MNKIQQIQTILGVEADGIWGRKSQAALDEEAEEAEGGSPEYLSNASSFADPADVVAFNECKQNGKTDLECFKVGDNGVGQFGKVTAQDHTPMCALHGSHMIAVWGSIKAAAHQKVEVTANGNKVVCLVEDRMSSKKAIIDLNPAAAKQLGLKPPFLVPASWRKV